MDLCVHARGKTEEFGDTGSKITQTNTQQKTKSPSNKPGKLLQGREGQLTMGNQHSASDGDRRPGPFSRSTGALGLSRSELDKRCQPSGLYDACAWDDKAVRKLVGDGKVVARLKGCESRTIDANQECPICFLYYHEINVTKCCSANICTECYLQVRPQKEKYSSCPFCINPKLTIGVAKKLSEEQIKERENEEKRAFEARMKAQHQQGADSTPTTTSPDENTPDNTIETKAAVSGGGGFGSNLAKDQRVALIRARSESMASSEGGTSNTSTDDNSIQTFAMSVDERRRLEEEMRAQHSHPLALRVEAEAAERRLQNDRAFYRSNSDSARRARAADLFRHHAGISSSSSSRRRGRGHQSSRDWNQIVDAWERGGNGEVQSIDDLVVLEAAILLSMEEESRRSREDGDEFDAARHAREGFPLVRTFLANRSDDSGGAPSSLTAGATPAELQSLARNLSSNRRRNQLLRATQGGRTARSTSSMPDTAMETASMLMRGISEEEQIAMAIAASLQEQQNEQNSAADANNGEGGGSTADQATSGSTTESGTSTRRSAELRLGNGETAVVGVVVEEDDEEENDDDEAEEVNQGVGVAVGISVEGEESGETEGQPASPVDSPAADTANTSSPLAGDTNPQSQAQLEAGIAIETETDDSIPINDETEVQL